MEETMSLAIVPRHALTVADWLALPEDPERRWELAEGQLVMAASAVPQHNRAAALLWRMLDDAAPTECELVPDSDLDLQLAPAGGPATVRRPDVSVVTRAAYDRVRREGGLLTAADCALVVEFLSPSTRRADRLVKRAEYADAGIEHYWIVDLDDGPSLIVGRLIDGRYEQVVHRGVVTVDAPFAVTVDLATLV